MSTIEHDAPVGSVSDRIPTSTLTGYRKVGIVKVTLLCGEERMGPVFEMHKRDRWPNEHLTVSTTLNGTPYMFRCSLNRKGRGLFPVNCAYFEHGGMTLFFYTHEGPLADGARVDFLRL